MPKFRPERLVYGGSIAEGDEPEPWRWRFAALLLAVAAFGVAMAAIYG